MKTKISYIAPVAMICVLALGIVAGRADERENQRNAYAVTSLVSDLKGVAAVQDPVLQNAWGVAFTPAGSPFWIADNATGCATLYNGDGTTVALQVSIPLPGNVVPATDCKTVNPNTPPKPTPAAPTGIIWNPTTNPATAFLVPGTNLPASFIFATEDGTVSAWASGLTPATNAVLAVDNSKTPSPTAGAVYKSLAFGVNVDGDFIYAANFRAGTIDVFDHNYKPATTKGGFVDPNIPAGFAPFSIKSLDGDLFVTYAKQNAQKHDDVAGPGNGFVDVFDTDRRQHSVYLDLAARPGQKFFDLADEALIISNSRGMIDTRHFDIFGARNMRGEISARLDQHGPVATPMEYQRRHANSREQVSHIKIERRALQRDEPSGTTALPFISSPCADIGFRGPARGHNAGGSASPPTLFEGLESSL
jgi:uncharacterized protein (TIGR03118 family)